MATNPFDALDSDVNPFDALDAPAAPPETSVGGLARFTTDPLITAAKGVIGAGEGVVGLADLVSGGHAGKALKDYADYDPKGSKEYLDTFLTPEQQAANAKVASAQGFGGKIEALIENPSTIAHMAGESLPLMLGGGAVAQGIRKVAPAMSGLVAGGIGEGVVGGGLAAEGIRQESTDGLLSGKQTLASLASGIGTGVLGVAGGKAAQKLGITDIDTILAGGVKEASKKGFLRRLVEGGISEGALEEMPQSAQEQMWQNYALDRPVMEGVPEAAGVGLVLGAAMGGPTSALLDGQPQVPPPGAMTPEQQAAANAANAGADQSLADYAGLAPELPAIAAVPSVIVPPAPPPPSLSAAAANAAGDAANGRTAQSSPTAGLDLPGALLTTYTDQKQAQADLELRQDKDRVQVIPHPRVAGAYAIVPKSRQELADMDAKALAETQATARTQQVQDEENPVLNAADPLKPGKPSGATFNGTPVESIRSPKGAEVTHHFTTAQGSEYVLTADGMTQRNKSAHANTGGEDAGVHAWNDQAAFVDPKHVVAKNAPFGTTVAMLKERGHRIRITNTGGALSVSLFDPKTKSWRQATTADAYPGSVKAGNMTGQEAIVAPSSAVPVVGHDVVEWITNPKTGEIKSWHPGSPVSTVTDATSANEKARAKKAAEEAAGVSDKEQTDLAPKPAQKVTTPAQEKAAKDATSRATKAAKDRAATVASEETAATTEAQQTAKAERKAKLEAEKAKRAGKPAAVDAAATNDAAQDEIGTSTGKRSTPREINEALRKQGVIGETEEATILTRDQLPDGTAAGKNKLSKQLYDSLTRLAKLFGKNIVVFSGAATDGFVIDNKTIYLNANSTVGQVAVMGHELLHQLKHDNKTAYAALKKVLTGGMTPEKWAEFDLAYNGKDKVGTMTKEELAEEFVADLVGNRFGEDGFWPDVFAKVEAQYSAPEARSIIRALAEAINRIMNAVIKAFGGSSYSTDKHVADRAKEVKAAVTQALADYMRQTKLDKDKPAEMLGTKLSKPKAEPKLTKTQLKELAQEEVRRIEEGKLVEQSAPLSDTQWQEVRRIALQKLTKGQRAKVLAAERQYQALQKQADLLAESYQKRAVQALAKTVENGNSAVGIMDGSDTGAVVGSGKLVRGTPKILVIDIGRFFVDRNKKLDVTTPEGRAATAVALAREAAYALAHDKENAVGWYDRKVKEAMAISALVHPELLTSKKAQVVFKMLAAITSNGKAVRDNFILANIAYTSYKSGVPLRDVLGDGGGKSRGAMLKSLQTLETLIAKHGDAGVVGDLMMQVMSVGDIKKQFGFVVAGEHVSTMLPAATGLGGPKIGSFFANLSGHFESLTMDMWFMRTLGRMTGNIVTVPKGAHKHLNELLSILPAEGKWGAYDVNVLRSEIEAFNALSASEQQDVETVQETVPKTILYARQQLQVFSAPDASGKTFIDRNQRNENARRVVSALDSTNDAPANGTERNNLREVTTQAQNILAKYGIHLATADLQAVLWYFEKNLYTKLGANNATAKPWDYASAARFGVGRTLGLVDVGSTKRAGQVRSDEPAGATDQLGRTHEVGGQGVGGTSQEVKASRNRGVNIEVAPDPRDAAAKAAFEAMSEQDKKTVTYSVAQRILPKLLADMGLQGEIEYTIGGFAGGTAPSIIVHFPDSADYNDVKEFAIVSGTLLRQQAAISYDENNQTDGNQTTFVYVEPSRPLSYEDQQALFAKMHAQYPAAQGFTGRNNLLVFGNFGSLDDTEFHNGIKAALAGINDVDYTAITRTKRFLSDWHEPLTFEGTRYESDNAAARRPDDNGGQGFIDALQSESDAAVRTGIAAPGVKLSPTRRNAASRGLDGRGIHYSKEERQVLASSAFGSGTNSEELERVKNAADERLKHRIYFYVNGGKGINPETGVGSHAHTAFLTNLYDIDADPQDIKLGSKDANMMESRILDAGFNGTISPERGVAVMLGPRRLTVEYMGVVPKPDVPTITGANPSAYGAAQRAIAANRALPGGQMSGADWKRLMPALMPQISVAHLDDDESYYKNQIAPLPARSLPAGPDRGPNFREARDPAVYVPAETIRMSRGRNPINGRDMGLMYEAGLPGNPPTKTRTVYKLMELPASRPGVATPLYAKPPGARTKAGFVVGEWYPALSQSVSIGNKDLAHRPGHHAVSMPVFDQGKGTVKGKQRAWVAVEMPEVTAKTQKESDTSPVLNNGMRSGVTTRVLGPNESYNFKTNPSASDDAGGWPISGSMKLVKVLSDREVARILTAAGLADQIENSKTGIDDARAKQINAEFKAVASAAKMSWSRFDNEADMAADSAAAAADWARKMASLKAGGKERDSAGRLLAPNGRVSNLTEEQYDQVRTPEFLGWFGDWLAAHNGKDEFGVWQDPDTTKVSKVVDENGEPLVVHHGTIFGGFTVLDPSKADAHRSSMVFTAKTRETSASYAGRKTEIDITGPNIDKMTGADLRQLGYDIYLDDEAGEWATWGRDGYLNGKFSTEAEAIANAREDFKQSGDSIRTQPGIYSLFLNIRNPYEADFEGANWDGQATGEAYSVFDENDEQVYATDGKGIFTFDDARALVERESAGAEWDIRQAGDRGETTNDVAEEAKRYGNDGAIIRQVLDDGGKSAYVEIDDVYVFFDSKQAKSATQHVGPNYGTEDLRFSTTREELHAGADAIRAMEPDQRDDMAPWDMPGGYHAFLLYEAQKLLPKATDKLRRATENNSFALHQDYDSIANVDGVHYGINKYEDPDDEDNEKAFVYAFDRLDDGGMRTVEPMTDQQDELFAAIRKDIAQPKMSLPRFQPTGHGQYLVQLKAAAPTGDVTVMDIPPALRAVVAKDGVKIFKKDRRVILGTPSTIINKGMNNHPNSEHAGPVSEDTLMNLPKHLADPLAIFSGEGGMNPNSYRVLTRTGAIVAVEPLERRAFIKTIYPTDDKQVQGWINAGLLHYVDEEGVAAGRAIPAAGAVGLTPGEPSSLLAGDTTGELVGAVIASPRTPIDWTIAKDAAQRKKRTVVTKAQLAGFPQVALSRPRGPVDVESPEFKAWFGDSKVVDADGRPLRVYHGTAKAFNKINMRKGAQGVFWVTSDRSAIDNGEIGASGKGAVMELYAKINNPAGWSEYDKFSIGELIGRGYDGIILRDNDGTFTAVVFEPTQIKSAISNTGEFDPTNPDIRESRQRFADAMADVDLHYDILNNVKNRTADIIAPNTGFNLWHKTVGTQFHKAMINPFFKKVFDRVQTFLSDAQLFALRAEAKAPSIFPSLDKLTWANLTNMGLSATDNALLGKALAEGTLDGGANPHDGKVWSDAELRAKYSMTDAQIGHYREARAAINQSLDELAVTEMAQHMRISGADVPTVERIAKSAQTLRAKYAQLVTLVDALEIANPGKDYGEVRRHLSGILSTTTNLQAHGYSPLQRFGQHTVTGYDDTGKVSFFTMTDTAAEAGVLRREMAALRLPSGLPEFANITVGKMNPKAHEMFAGMTMDTLELFANNVAMPLDDLMQDYLKMAVSNRSTLKKLIARKGTAGFSKDATRVTAGFITSNGRRAAKNLHGVLMAKAVTDIPKEMGDIGEEAASLVTYVNNPVEEAAKLRGFLFFNYLGGSIAAAIVNMTQPVLQTFPRLSVYGVGKAAAAMTVAGKHTASWMRNKTVSDPDLQAALVRAQSDGHINPQEIYQLMAAANSGASSFLTHKIQRVWGLNFSVTEMFNRTLTFSAAYQLAKDSGSATPYDDAIQVITETQGLYNKGNRPNWARGAIGATLFTFKQFGVAYMEFLKRAWGDGLIPKKQVVLALGLLILAAGTNGLPGADDLDDLIDTVGSWLGYATNSKRWKRDFLTKWLGKEMAEFAMVGMSKYLPVDVQARLGVSNLIPGTAMLNPTRKDTGREVAEVFGVAGGLAKSVGTAAEAVAKDDYRKAGLAVLPTAVKNALMAKEMWQTGKYKDIGNKLVTEVTPADAIAKGIGFQPNSVARKQRAIRETQIEIDIVTSKQGEFMTRIANAVADNDGEGREKALRDLREWNATNPDYRIRIGAGALRQAVRQRVMSKDVRFIKQAPKTIRSRINEELRGQQLEQQ